MSDTVREVILVVLLIGLVSGDVLYNQTINLPIDQVYTRPIPAYGYLRMNITTDDRSLFSLEVIAEDEDHNPAYVPGLDFKKVENLTYDGNYTLPPGWSNSQILITNANQAGTISKLHLFISSIQPVSEPQWYQTHWLALLSFGGIVALATALIILAIHFFRQQKSRSSIVDNETTNLLDKV